MLPAVLLEGSGSPLPAALIICATSGWLCFAIRIQIISRVKAAGSSTSVCTVSASYEVSQAQKAILLDHTAKGASTSSEELNAQISPRTDDEHNLPYHEDYLQEH